MTILFNVQIDLSETEPTSPTQREADITKIIVDALEEIIPNKLKQAVFTKFTHIKDGNEYHSRSSTIYE